MVLLDIVFRVLLAIKIDSGENVHNTHTDFYAVYEEKEGLAVSNSPVTDVIYLRFLNF